MSGTGVVDLELHGSGVLPSDSGDAPRLKSDGVARSSR
eukprot:CAMPEP_0197632104 /NCGR_PEP_ID=MMETSP1338-20131121/9014_1 /TAXON_ID=43686 ORGANISM="Pelagodinium beii, Strain RCC1491" /NCGR_SAMPLE_ID=MMETSP1338 /ASSEMBLY_ACC=CAM_ASM_000754 /LENGTH=37 /DNA_ID= /DNA_START= /DNA_END= /DNA_ORIENTATION=